MSPRFRPSAELQRQAARVLSTERARLADLDGAVLELTGATSVRGALSGGDIDLHLRVSPERFEGVVATLRERYEVVLPEIWTSTLATFTVPGAHEVGVAVTPIGSEHDRRFVEAWNRLRSDAAALEAYNAMKLANASASPDAYRAAKRAFFDQLAADASLDRS